MEYTPELCDKICAEIADGRSLSSVCKDEGMPHREYFWKWKREHPELQKQYDNAVKERVALFAEELIDICDDGTNDWVESNDPENPGYKFNKEHFQRSRLRIDTRKWLLAKMHPKQYGDKVDLTHASPDGGPVRFQKVERVIVDPENRGS